MLNVQMLTKQSGALFTKHDYQNQCVTLKIVSATNSSKELGTNISYYFKYLAVKHTPTKPSTWLDK
jgi:hypothetical protein